jgi:3-carboxy-cis,cis-muconate cycloisomerase
MSDLLWPGDDRAGDLMSDPSLLIAMVRVESAWLAALVELKVADPSAADDLAGLVSDGDIGAIASAAEAGGNPVIPLVALLRARVEQRTPTAAQWIHRGLTSQDVLDTALQLSMRDVTERLGKELRAQIAALVALAEQHRGSVMAGRTLTQHAVPVTFGLKATTWLQGVLDAAEDLARAAEGMAGQFGGAAGTLAAPSALAARAGVADPNRAALDLAAYASETLSLRSGSPWHTARAKVTRVGDALVGYTDALGRIANDVLVLARPEIGELAEPTAEGRGASSAMPQKANPILSVLIRRAALAAPGTGAQLHLAAAEAVDERPDGAWHTEWATLRTLARHTVAAASQATELLSGLLVDAERMRTNAEAATDDLLAEGRSLSDDGSMRRPDGYLGATDLLIDSVLARARRQLEETP